MEKYVIGLDYGSDSARAIVVNALTGETLATAVKYYPRWKEGKYCNPAINQYRQHPQDYIDVLEASVKEALAACPAGTAEKVVGIAFDTTGSTPAFTDATGTPLALLPEFAENPNAMFIPATTLFFRSISWAISGTIDVEAGVFRFGSQRIVREVLELDKAASSILTLLFFSFGYVMVTCIVPSLILNAVKEASQSEWCLP